MKYQITSVVFKLSQMTDRKRILDKKRITIESEDRVTVAELKVLIKENLNIEECEEEKITFIIGPAQLEESDMAGPVSDYEITIK